MKCILFIVLLAFVAFVSADGVIPKFFKKLGQYSFTDATGENKIKSYFITRDFKLNWGDAHSFCKSFEMDLVALETAAESDYFFNLCEKGTNNFYPYLFIGGTNIGVEKDSWYWMKTGSEIKYKLRFSEGEPYNAGGRENCLAIYNNVDKKTYGLNDLECYGDVVASFACEKVTNVCSKNYIDIDCTPALL
ncbi:unnamed protein product [Diamesa hyperborea]